MDRESLLKRRGCFTLNSRDCYYDLSFWGQIMAKMLITRCEHMLLDNLLVYHAYSSLFREVPDLEKSPHYEIRSNEHNDIEAIELIKEA